MVLSYYFISPLSFLKSLTEWERAAEKNSFLSYIFFFLLRANKEKLSLTQNIFRGQPLQEWSISDVLTLLSTKTTKIYDWNKYSLLERLIGVTCGLKPIPFIAVHVHTELCTYMPQCTLIEQVFCVVPNTPVSSVSSKKEVTIPSPSGSVYKSIRLTL